MNDEELYRYDPTGVAPVLSLHEGSVPWRPEAGTVGDEGEADVGEVGAHNATFLEGFSVWYQGVHGYASLSCCVLGIVSNLMNIAVLTRKSMISPTNHLLTALAITDLLTMLSYLPFALYFHCISAPDRSTDHPQAWIVYLLINTAFTITSHTIAIWLTVALAVFRYIAVCHHASAPVWCNLARARGHWTMVALIVLIIVMSGLISATIVNI